MVYSDNIFDIDFAQITNEISTKDRENVYKEGGILHITARNYIISAQILFIKCIYYFHISLYYRQQRDKDTKARKNILTKVLIIFEGRVVG